MQTKEGMLADSVEEIESGCCRDVWWSENGREWHVVVGTPWNARHAATVFVHEDSLWLAAGSRTDILDGCRSDVWRLSRTSAAGAKL